LLNKRLRFFNFSSYRDTALLRQGVTHIVVYWPPLAKMATTYTELVLLCD